MFTDKFVKRTINKDAFYSNYLDEERSVRIYLPPGFNELTSYPIVYTQDGQDMFMFGRIATIANYLILEKGMEPTIIVGVDVSKTMRTAEYSPLGERNAAYKKFFAEELIPFIEGRFLARKTGIERLLIGDSLGGTVSLDLALDYPQMFAHLLSLSGAFYKPTLTRLQHISDLSWLNIWMLVGTQEDSVKTHLGTLNFLEWNRNIKGEFRKRGAQMTYVEKEGKHIWGFWQKELPEGLLHFFKQNEFHSS